MNFRFSTFRLLFALIALFAVSHTLSFATDQKTTQPTELKTELLSSDATLPAQKPENAALESCEIETASFADVIKRVGQEVDEHQPEKVLLVVDIDNTTLAMDQELGSDQWYNWQYNFIFKDIDSPLRVAKDLEELLHVQGLLFAMSNMHPPEPEIPAMISSVQELGCPVVVLTSRGPEYRDATERELKRNGYDFSNSAVPIIEPTRGKFLPYDKSRPNVNGLSAAELESLRDPRPISYENGIMMTAGQHKGYMLRTLLARSQDTFEAIVFVDDHKKHTTRMLDAFKDSGTTTACFHYVFEQPNVDAFNESNKELVAEKWQKLSDVIADVFGASAR
jgi:hypothetical protein